MIEPKAVKSHVFPRAADEWYVEETRATDQLVQCERSFAGPGRVVLDPCCGQGNIVTTLRRHGVDAIGTDIVERAPGQRWFHGFRDFLTEEVDREVTDLVMNPPFGGSDMAEQFIRRAHTFPWIERAAFFVEARFLFSEARAYGLHRYLPPARIWPLTPRVSTPPGQYLLDGGKAQGGKADHVWMVYEIRNARSYPQAVFGWRKRL